MGKKKQAGLFVEDLAGEILAVIGDGKRLEHVILIVPSHDRRNKEIPDQALWAKAASELFADLYTGATAFKAYSGIYKTPEGEILIDIPILMESYVSRADLMDSDKLKELLAFSVRMGQETHQHTVALFVNDFMHKIRIPSKDDGDGTRT